MLKAIFTLDYEIHGNGEGDPYHLMVEPTERMMQLFEQYGAKLTILADVAEIQKFKQYAEENARDDYHFHAIANQLKDAVRRGHDVQLHLHSSYFNARNEKGYWLQDWTEYDFANLTLARMQTMLGIGKAFLEGLLKPVDPNYRCHVFRAANWSVSPSQNVADALLSTGFDIDTSIFKYGKRSGPVNFDYSDANSNIVPWRAKRHDLWLQDEQSKLWEFPIYCELQTLPTFFSLQRIYRAIVGRLHYFDEKVVAAKLNLHIVAKAKIAIPFWKKLTKKFAWKADFNQCTGRQLMHALNRAEKSCRNSNTVYPFVLIGHSKLFTGMNAFSLRPFLAYIKQHPERFEFGKFSDFNLTEKGNDWEPTNLVKELIENRKQQNVDVEAA